MSDLGQLLRKARMERNISLDQLQESTKIRKRYLEAIEEGNYDVLPGTFYTRAFIKQYSEAVGLDPNEVFRLYSHCIPPAETESVHDQPIRMTRRGNVDPPERMGKWASALLMIAFPILIIGVVYYFVLANSEPQDSVLPNEPITKKTSDEIGGETGTAGNELPEVSAPQPNEQMTPPPSVPETSAETLHNVTYVDKFTVNGNPVERFEIVGSDKVKIDLEVTGSEAWIGITHADKKSKYLYQGSMKKTEKYSGEFDHNVYLNIGRANAVKLTINGVSIDMGTEPNPRKFQFELKKET